MFPLSGTSTFLYVFLAFDSLLLLFFTNRVEFVPEDCIAIVEDSGVCGYVVSYPCRRRHHPSAPHSLVLDIASGED